MRNPNRGENKLLMRDYEILRLRERPIPSRVELIQDEFGYTLPSIFKAFLENFEWSSSMGSKSTYFFFPFPQCGDLHIIGTDPVDMIEFSASVDYEEVDKNQGILIFKSRLGVYVGTLEDQQDKVYARFSSTGQFQEVASNIFEFINGLTNDYMRFARSESEYRDCMIKLGSEGEVLEEELEEWRVFDRSR